MGGWGSPWPKRDPKAQRVILQVLFLFLFLGMFFVFLFFLLPVVVAEWSWCLFCGSLTSKQMPD